MNTSEKRTAPVDLGAPTPSGSRSNPTNRNEEKGTNIMTQATDVPLPTGADPENVDNWETDGGVTSRLVWSIPDITTKAFDCDVRVVASQRMDGTIIVGDPVEEPLVYIDGADYTLQQASALALALLDAIRLAASWGAK